MRIQSLGMLLTACAFSAACTSTLTPATGAREAAGPAEGAIVSARGISLKARADAWRGEPRSLHQHVTPMLVTIVNESANPIRIGYNQFRLLSTGGRRYSALPPYQIDGPVPVTPVTSFYPPVGFRLAPHLSPHFAGVPIYDGKYVTNPGYWDRFGRSCAQSSCRRPTCCEKGCPRGCWSRAAV